MAPHRIATPELQDEDMSMAYSEQGSFSNPESTQGRPLLPGIYAPTPCFFHDDDELDRETIGLHAVRLARAGLAGITTQGSNGEAVHLTPSERQLVTRTTRAALDAAGYLSLPIIVGCGAQSTREAISLCRDAAQSGGDYVLVLPPSYYKASYPRSSLAAHFRAIADASSLPVMIYNYPGAASGIDLDSDFLLELAQHPNIVGVKLTCANVGKLGRIVSSTSSASPLSSPVSGSEPDLLDTSHTSHLHTPKTTPTPSISDLTPDADTPSRSSSKTAAFTVLAGSADFLLPSLSVGAHGGLVGLANIVPKSCVALQRAHQKGNHNRARHLQSVLGRADEVVQKMGVVGTKAVLQAKFGYGGHARRPLPRVGEEIEVAEAKKWLLGFEEAMALEDGLQ